MDYRTIQGQFSSGILSPLSSGLVGSDMYSKGLEIAENAFFSPLGSVYKRNGTVLKDRFTAANADKYRPRIITLKHPRSSNESGYITFVFIKGNIIIYDANCDNNKTDADKSSRLVQLGSAKSFFNNPSELSIATQDDKIYIVHKDYPPRIVEGTLSDGKYIFYLNDISFVAPQTPAIAEGAVMTTSMLFNNEGDYPSIQCFYDGRWFVAGTKNEPLKIWASRSFDAEKKVYRYDDFTFTYQVAIKDTTSGALSWQYVDLADLACQYKISSSDDANLSWLYEFQGLILGTDKGIYICTTKAISSSTDNPLNFTKENSIGASKNLITCIGNYLLYVGIDKQTINALAYSQQYNSYSGGGVSSAVSHYLSEIIQIVTVDGEIPKLYVLDRKTGLLCCHFSPQNSMIAWTRLTFANYHPLAIGYIPTLPERQHNALAIISGHMTSIDDISITKKFDNYCAFELLENTLASQAWKYPQVDKYEILKESKTVVGTTTAEQVTPYPYTKKNTYVVIADNEYWNDNLDIIEPAQYEVLYPSKIYNTTITPETSRIYILGDGYTFAICTTRAELPANGTSQGTIRAVKKAILRLYSSYGGEIFLFSGFSAGLTIPPNLGDIKNDIEHDESTYPPYMRQPLNFAKIPFYKIFNENKYGEKLMLFDGDIDIQFTTPSISDDRIAIVQREPLPFSVCALITTRAVKEA